MMTLFVHDETYKYKDHERILTHRIIYAIKATREDSRLELERSMRCISKVCFLELAKCVY